MERLNGWQRFNRSMEWIIAPHKAHERERLEKEAEQARLIEELRSKLQTPQMKARVAQILDKYNLVAYRENIVVPPDGKEAKLLIEPAYQEAFKQIVRNQRPATVFYSMGKMDEMGVPGVMWIDEGEVRISSNQYVFAMFGGVFDHAEEMGYRKIEDGVDFVTQTPYGRFIQAPKTSRI
jgi:hypothetical protein